MKKLFFPAAAVLLMTACAPKTTETKNVSEGTKYPSAEIEEGNGLYANNCGKCHDLPKESKYNDEQWKKIVPPMASKAKLDATQENKILQYVLWKSAQK